jgi:peptidyl-prolyl cis-trans isomerase SurA
MKKVAAAALALAVSIVPAFAQEQQLVEEVVARVNADVITRSQYMEVLDQTVDDIKKNTQDPAEAEKRINEFKPRILDLMIDSLLIVQKGQDLGIDVEADVNRQFLELARQQNMGVTELEEAMRQGGIDPNDVRARLRERLVKDRVMNQEVYGAVWRALTEKEKREYYEKNKEKFMQPGELKLSELFIPVEGRSFSEIETKGREIVAAARGGAGFADLVKKHGDPNRASYANAGLLGSFKSEKDLAPALASAITSLKTGEVTEPLRVSDGVLILRVDERREPAARPFEEVSNDVALWIVQDRGQEAEQRYVEKLRAEAYIKITPGYKN